MNKQEEFKAHIIECALNGLITVAQAAKKLNLSQRYVKKLKRSFKLNGKSSLLHGNCGRQPKNTIDPFLKTKILALKKDNLYIDANFTHFREILHDTFNINISYSALYSLLKNNGFSSPRKRRKIKLHHRRLPKAREGELLQVDGTPHKWFENDNNLYSLHGFIDDATGKITGLFMCKNECMQGYFEVLRQTLNNFGVPEAIYADGSSIFFPKKNIELSIEEQLSGIEVNKTQYSKILDELSINLIHTGSSQAKGKIERLWNTLHDRLYTEFKINNLSTIEQANSFLIKYIIKFNKQFAKKPSDSHSAFIPLLKSLNLDILLSVKKDRVVDVSNSFSIDKVTFKIDSKDILHKKHVSICISKKIGIKALYSDKLYDVTPIFDKHNLALNSSESVQAIISNFIFYYCLKNERINV